MKNIILACGSGIATSTAVAAKVKDLLDSNGFDGQYKITQCAIAEAVGKSADADLLIATTVKPDGIQCPYIAGVPFLTGIGRADAEKQILDFMAE
jgi:PTS system galactitol-specific IIB component